MSESPTPEPREPRQSRAARGARRPLDVTLVLAVVLPLVGALALFLTNPGFGTSYFHPATKPSITHATVVCPGSSGSGDHVGIASAGSGDVTVGQPDGQTVTIPEHGTGVASGDKGPALITASGSAAPGLTATRSSTDPVAAATCTRPRADQWFAGLGAGPTHDSVVELVNPNPGPAVADLTMMSDTGPLDVPALRGIAVPGGGSRTFDLGAVMPTQSALALHAVVERGQVAVAVRDRATHLVGSGSDEDWLPAQQRPARRVFLLGLVSGGGSRQLTVANPSDGEVTATVRLVSANSIFTPDNAPTLDIAPQSVSRVDLGKVLGSGNAGDVSGVQVVATGAVVASLRSTEGGDIALVGGARRMRAATSAVVPAGPKHLTFEGAGRSGALTVVSRDAGGRKLSSKRVAISPGQALSVDVPADAVRVDVSPDGIAFRGAVVLQAKDGASVVPLLRAAVAGRVPYVKPGLPR